MHSEVPYGYSNNIVQYYSLRFILNSFRALDQLPQRSLKSFMNITVRSNYMRRR